MIGPEDFNSWRNDPRTKAVLQFLRDYRESYKEAWARGTEFDPSVQGQAQMLNFVAELQHKSIREFYTSNEESNDENSES